MGKPEIKTRHYIECPKCGHEFIVDHILGDTHTYQWACGVECDQEAHIHATNGELDVEFRTRDVKPALALLKFGDVWLVANSYGFSRDAGSSDYFWHSHQCPTNILGSVEEVFTVHGPDTHGLFRLVAEIEATPEIRGRLGAMTLRELFAAFRTDGQPLPSEWPESDRGVIPWVAEMQRDYERKGET